MQVSWFHDISALMEHPEVPFWTSEHSVNFAQAADLPDVVSSFCTPELRQLASLPGVGAANIHQCLLGQMGRKPT
eukprot:459690-Karenia_brevis.AAC.1